MFVMFCQMIATESPCRGSSLWLILISVVGWRPLVALEIITAATEEVMWRRQKCWHTTSTYVTWLQLPTWWYDWDWSHRVIVGIWTRTRTRTRLWLCYERLGHLSLDANMLLTVDRFRGPGVRTCWSEWRCTLLTRRRSTCCSSAGDRPDQYPITAVTYWSVFTLTSHDTTSCCLTCPRHANC